MINSIRIRALFFVVGTSMFSSDVFSGNQYQGSTLYKQHCAMCHGANGKNRLPNAANFQRGEGLRQSNQQLFDRIRRGNNGCPSYAGILQEQQIIDVISHLRNLSR